MNINRGAAIFLMVCGAALLVLGALGLALVAIVLTL